MYTGNITLETIIGDLAAQKVAEALKPYAAEISTLKEEVSLLKKGIIVEEYMPKEYFLQKYKRGAKPISSETFRRIRNSGNVHKYKKLGVMLYNVEDMNKAYDRYKPKKPVFEKQLKVAG